MADQDNKQESQKWLTFLETGIEEQQDELDFVSEAAYYEVIRDMLLHQGDSDEAISQAIKRCYDHYLTSIDAHNARYAEDDAERPKPFEYEYNGILNSITSIVFETVGELPYLDPKNDIISKFLIGMAKNIPPQCIKEGRDNIRDLVGVQAGARQPWEASHADTIPLHREGPEVEGLIHIWLNTSALVAKLFQADLLGVYGPLWVSNDFKLAFETRTDGDVTKHPLRQAQVLAVANYILISGEAFAKAVTTKEKAENYELTAEKWKNWASKFQEVADAVDEGARWGLKDKAQKAHDKMVELYPEAFE